MDSVAEQSLQEKVRAARKRKQANALIKVSIPGWPMLIGRYHPVDWRTKGEIDLRHENDGDRMELIRSVQAEFLLAANDGIEAVDGSERTDLGVKLGLGLAGWLGLNEPASDGPLAQTDLDALYLILEDGADVIEHAAEVKRLLREQDERVDEHLAGESEAAS
jgi:hypothetical protein